MDDEIPLTFGEKVLELLISVPDTVPYQLATGLGLSLLTAGLLVGLGSLKPKGDRSRPAIRNKKRIKLTTEELREVRTRRTERSGRGAT